MKPQEGENIDISYVILVDPKTEGTSRVMVAFDTFPALSTHLRGPAEYWEEGPEVALQYEKREAMC